MPNVRTLSWRHCWQLCRHWLDDATRPAPAGIRPGPRLELTLRPASRARWCGGLFLLLALVHAAGLWRQGNQPLALGTLVAVLFASAVLWHWLWPSQSRSFRQLQLEPDGSTFLLTADGRRQAVTLIPGSLRLGQHLLLVLRAGDCCHRLLLGPGNTDPDRLAALRRRLRRPPTVPGLLR